MTFFSKSMNEVQCNYDRYNKELLGLLEMFRHWCPYLHQAQHKVWVYTIHTDLLFWKNPRDHNRRVAWWHTELMGYDFKLIHISGAKNGQADALSRCPDYDKGDEDNKKLVVLPEHFFVQDVHAHLARTEWANPHKPGEWQKFIKKQDNMADYQSIHDWFMADQINNSQQPLLKQWLNTHQLIHKYGHCWKGTQPIVASDNDLKRGVIQLFHNNPATGHQELQIPMPWPSKTSGCLTWNNMSSNTLRVAPLSKKVNPHQTPQTCYDPYHPRTFTSIPDHHYGLHHEAAPVWRIQHYPDNYRPRLF